MSILLIFVAIEYGHMKTAYFAFVTLLLTASVVSCRKNPEQPNTDPPKSKHIQVSINHIWDDSSVPLVLNQDFTHPTTNESFNFTTCKYYLSNFQFRKTDGTWWSHPFSYNLVSVSQSNNYEFTLPDVPFGTYDAVRFLIGVDSAKNVSGAQAGDLAPSNAMFWSWSTGYIMIKLEGSSPQADLNYFSFHIGGFMDSDNSNTTRWKEISLAESPFMVTGQNEPKLKLFADISKAWNAGNLVSEVNSVHSASTRAQYMADQFMNAFSLEGVE
jgi:hypothetical protein